MTDNNNIIHGVDLRNGGTVFDDPSNEGIVLELPIGCDAGNMYAKFFFTDEEAEELIKIIQNKLNGRLK